MASSSQNLNLMKEIRKFCSELKIEQKIGEFSIVSWNCLAQIWLEEKLEVENYGFKHIKGSPYANWDFRLQLIKQSLEKLNPSIICLQEIEIPNFERDFGQWLRKNNYSWIEQHPKKKLLDHGVGNLILYKIDNFVVTWQESRSKALLVCLQQLNVPFPFYLYIANLHLQSSPLSAATRFQQEKHLLHKLSLQQAEHSEFKYGTIICGDFNSNEEESSIQFLKNGFLPANQIDNSTGMCVNDLPCTHPFHFKEVKVPFKGCKIAGKTISTFPTYFAPTNIAIQLDHIFYSDQQLELQAVLVVLDEDEIQKMFPLHVPPSQVLPSDHLPIGCVFRPTT